MVYKHKSLGISPSVDGQEVESRPSENSKVERPQFIVLEDTVDIFNSRIQINDNNIKHTIICHNSNVIGEHSLIPADFTSQELERAQANSRFNILSLINDSKAHRWVDSGCDHMEEFCKAISIFDCRFKILFDNTKDTDAIRFDLLPYFIKKNDLIAFKSDDTWIGCKINSADMQYTFMGPVFKIDGKSIHHNGQEFMEVITTKSIGYYEGEKTIAELGISVLLNDPSLQELLIARGKKYERVHKKSPAYMLHSGSIMRRSYWFNHKFPATGRIMIDRAGMMNIDPDYDKYFGNRNNYNDENDFSGTNSEFVFTDVLYMITSPYCYGFSFVAKQWGEIHIDHVSDIYFRDDAYENLVLDSETKEILFSLTETSEQGKDIVDGKGGGCIFLLHGLPGVGKQMSN